MRINNPNLRKITLEKKDLLPLRHILLQNPYTLIK